MLRFNAPDRIPEVALLAEGVDRNNLEEEFVEKAVQSPSSRRAWIEIRIGGECY